MSVKIQDYGRTVSKVVATAITPDGEPALLPVQRPLWDYREITYTNGNPTKIEYKRGGASGTLVLTENHTYDGNGNCLTTTLDLPQ